MKIIYLVLLILFATGIIYAAETTKARVLDIGTLSADPNIHEAVYTVLKTKGISCSGLSTRKDGTITVLNPSSTEKITVAEIQKELDKIIAQQEIEKLITIEIRSLAIESLKKKGIIPADYKDK